MSFCVNMKTLISRVFGTRLLRLMHRYALLECMYWVSWLPNAYHLCMFYWYEYCIYTYVNFILDHWIRIYFTSLLHIVLLLSWNFFFISSAPLLLHYFFHNPVFAVLLSSYLFCVTSWYILLILCCYFFFFRDASFLSCDDWLVFTLYFEPVCWYWGPP